MNAVTRLAGDLAAHLDPVIFAERCGITPDPWQADILRSGDDRVLMLAARQVGKSTVAALRALHRAVFWPGSLILLLSPSLRQSSELFRVVLRFQAGDGAAPVKDASSLKLELENGSRIISLPGSEATIRGYAGVDLLIVDEAARVDDDLFRSVLPMLATSQGALIALSTPFGKRGFFADAWHGPGSWRRVRVGASDCPRIDPEWLAAQRETMGDWWFRQEFEVEFIDATSSAFRSADIDAATTGEVVETWSI